MASIVPKIKVGLAASKKDKINLSFDCSTTANIGSVQPTMCREMVPKSKFKVKVSSLVRLASMPLPTFGRMSLRHYHAFVPYVDIWQPFDAMMSGQHYYGKNGNTDSNFIPTEVPWFTLRSLRSFFTNYSDISIAPITNLDKPYQITTTNVSAIDGTVFNFGEGEDFPTYQLAVLAAQGHDLSIIKTAWDAVRNGGSGSSYIFGGTSSDAVDLYGFRGSVYADSWLTDDYGKLNFGAFAGHVGNVDSSYLKIGYSGVSNPTITYSNETVITPEGADLITKVGDYYLLLKFKPFLKRLRTIFIGCGYQFSPYSDVKLSVLKLFAYYKTWFNLFCPNRERAFVDTNCYRLIKYWSERNGGNVDNALQTYWIEFLKELATECYYYLPMDYFTMSVVRPQQTNQDSDFKLYSGAGFVAGTTTAENESQGGNGAGVSVNPSAGTPIVKYDSTQSPMTLKLAFQMLKWANKNTVIGRSVRQYLKVHFGVDDVNPIDDGGVYRIGSSRTNIQISDVMSTAENEQGYLGEYGGKGIGYGDSETFDFSTDKFGVWFTLTAVVPESGYYQGYLKENRHTNRYQFFNPEFDALGYQVLERGEVMDDYNCDGAAWNPRTEYKRTTAFGLVPRYSEYKVGRNIVNGDLSLVGLYSSMSPYTLDRRIAGGSYKFTSVDIPGSMSRVIVKPEFVPSVVYDGFRRIDPTDHLGQYNRIFNYGGNDLDHFIIHNIFDVSVYAPMKSLTNSFDTVDEGESTIEVTHS